MLRERERKSGWWIECFDHSSWSKVGESMFAEVYVNGLEIEDDLAVESSQGFQYWRALRE